MAPIRGPQLVLGRKSMALSDPACINRSSSFPDYKARRANEVRSWIAEFRSAFPSPQGYDANEVYASLSKIASIGVRDGAVDLKGLSAEVGQQVWELVDRAIARFERDGEPYSLADQAGRAL